MFFVQHNSEMFTNTYGLILKLSFFSIEFDGYFKTIDQRFLVPGKMSTMNSHYD